VQHCGGVRDVFSDTRKPTEKGNSISAPDFRRAPIDIDRVASQWSSTRGRSESREATRQMPSHYSVHAVTF
jgi:hypothetical protein